MKRIHAIFDGPLIVSVYFKHDRSGAAPAFLIPFFNDWNWRAFAFGCIAQEGKNYAVGFVDRISVNFCAPWDFAIFNLRNFGALA